MLLSLGIVLVDTKVSLTSPANDKNKGKGENATISDADIGDGKL